MMMMTVMMMAMMMMKKDDDDVCVSAPLGHFHTNANKTLHVCVSVHVCACTEKTHKTLLQHSFSHVLVTS